MTPAEDAPRTAPSDEAATPAALAEENARLRAENAALKETIAVLLARVAELERRLGLNSSNSGKPPSSDGLHKPKREPRTRSLRERSGKPSGGQKGHKGETLCQVADPNVTIDHYPETCGTCGLALTAAMATRCSARQVFDLPEPQPLIVTEHRAYRCRCGRCGGETRAPSFPRRSRPRCNMARASWRSWSICSTTSCCPRTGWPRPWLICSGPGWWRRPLPG